MQLTTCIVLLRNGWKPKRERPPTASLLRERQSGRYFLKRRPYFQLGSSLLEVLIAVALFSITALGIIAMNATMMMRGQSSVDQTLAASLAESFLMEVRQEGALEMAAAQGMEGGGDGPGAAVLAWKIDPDKVGRFKTKIAAILTKGTVDVTQEQAKVTVQINWQGPKDDAPRMYRTAVAIHP